MGEPLDKPRYSDTEYQECHDDIFSHPLKPDIETVLPPGVSQEDFSKALEEFRAVVGEKGIYSGANLKEYVDPYDIPESGHGYSVPSAAVW